MIEQINKTTYKLNLVNDIMSTVVIGGRDDSSKFVPVINNSIGFGGPEEVFEVINRKNKITSSKSEIKFDGETIQLIEGDDIDEFEFKNGKIKHNIIFDKCPKSMIIDFEVLRSNNIQYLYQDTLENEWNNSVNLQKLYTLKEYKRKIGRSEDIVDSYACYFNKSNNFIRPINFKLPIPKNWKSQLLSGANLADLNIADYREYKSGKFMHKYRSFVIDSIGQKSWCKFVRIGNIDRYILSEDFMKNIAKYPVKLDPTFGNTSIGGSTDYWTNSKAAYATSTPSADGTLDFISVYCVRTADTGDLQVALYTDSASNPDAQLAVETTTCGTVTTTPAWVSTNLSTAVVTSTQYWLGFQESASLLYYYDAGTNETAVSNSATLDDPFNAGSLQNQRTSAYGSFTESGGPAPPVLSIEGIVTTKAIGMGILRGVGGF